MSLEIDRVDLSLVLPCYNSARFLAESVADVRRALRRSCLSYELIFVDDASRDHTVAVIEQLLAGHEDARFLRHPRNTGRGRAVMDGMRLARGRVVGFTDVDLATPAHYIPTLVDTILDGADVATALRVYKLSPPILHRWALSRGYNFLVRKALGQSFHDSETGCKFFSARGAAAAAGRDRERRLVLGHGDHGARLLPRLSHRGSAHGLRAPPRAGLHRAPAA